VSDQTAKAVGTVGIWIAVAIILAFGVFRMNWNGDVAMLLMVVVVFVICGAAGFSTASVWGWRPGKATSEDRRGSP
jgi:hypothetical protein